MITLTTPNAQLQQAPGFVPVVLLYNFNLITFSNFYLLQCKNRENQWSICTDDEKYATITCTGNYNHPLCRIVHKHPQQHTFDTNTMDS
jgi:hypothetical protein